MPPYGTEHPLVLALTAVAAVLLVRWARRSPTPQVDTVLRRAGWVLLVNNLAWILWGFAPWSWNIDESLPPHFSDALRVLTPIALITRARWAVVVSWYWGLTLNLQSVLTPDVNYFVWPPLEFAEYWIGHSTALLAPIVLRWGCGFRPTWRSYALAYAATVGWAAVAFTGNLLSGANYAYLMHAPAGPSLLDALGPWPWYLLSEAVAIAVVWAAMTWPFTRRR